MVRGKRGIYGQLTASLLNTSFTEYLVLLLSIELYITKFCPTPSLNLFLTRTTSWLSWWSRTYRMEMLKSCKLERMRQMLAVLRDLQVGQIYLKRCKCTRILDEIEAQRKWREGATLANAYDHFFLPFRWLDYSFCTPLSFYFPTKIGVKGSLITWGPVINELFLQILYFIRVTVMMWISTFPFIYYLSRREGPGFQKIGYETAVIQAFTAVGNNFVRVSPTWSLCSTR